MESAIEKEIRERAEDDLLPTDKITESKYWDKQNQEYNPPFGQAYVFDNSHEF